MSSQDRDALVYALLSGTAMMLVLSGLGWIVALLLKGSPKAG